MTYITIRIKVFCLQFMSQLGIVAVFILYIYIYIYFYIEV